MFTAAALLASTTGVAHGDLLSYYNFNNGLASGTQASLTQTPAQGNGSLAITAAAPTNVLYFGGTLINAVGADPAGNALAIQNGTSGANNGSTQTYQLSTTGFNNLKLTYATQGTGTGFTSQNISYSTNNVTFTSFTSAFTIPSSFGLRTVDLSGVPALQNTPNVFVRITHTGGSISSSSGNNRFDNVQFNAAALATGNNTTITATPTTAAFGRVIVGATPTQSISLSKTGSDTTGYNITSSGDATSDSLGGAFVAGAQTVDFNVGVTTATAGTKSGTVTVANTAVSSANPGQGNLDPNDVIGVSATVLNASNASFDAVLNQDIDSIDLGTVTQGDPTASQSFNISNLLSTLGITSALDLDSIQFDGLDDAAISTDLVTFVGLAAGDSNTFNAFLDTTQVGVFNETLLLNFSDENVLGETTNQLTLNITGTVAPVSIPEPAGLALIGLGGLVLLSRRRRDA